MYKKQGDQITTEIKFNSYVDALNKNDDSSIDFNSFSYRLLKDSNYGVESRKCFYKYLNMLLELEKTQTTNTSSGGKKQECRKSIKGLLTAVSPKGKVIMIEYSGYENLMDQLDQKIALEKLLEQQMEYLKTRSIKRHRVNKKGQDKDQGIGM